jgi:type IV pilus assembly protein PilC
MTFRYTVYTNDKKIIRGTLESDSRETAEASLYRAGFKRILKLEKSGSRLDIDKLFASPPRVSKESLMDFTTELAVLTESGLTLVSALRQLEKGSSNKSLKGVLTRLVEDLLGGTPFHQALCAHPRIFSETYCSIMEANEKAGTLDAGLRQIARQLKQQIATKSQIQRAVMQPAIVIGLAIVVVILMILVVLPPLMDVFSQFGTQLPLTTRILIGLAGFLKKYTLFILVALVIGGLSTLIFLKRPSTKPHVDRLLLRIPLIGQVINWNNTAQFSRTLSNLLGAGILLPDSINILLRGISNTCFRESLSEARKQMVQGQSLSAVMSKNELFPPLLVEMIGVGEVSGNLESSLGTVADYFESKVEKRINKLTSLLEPALLLGVGLVVGFIAVTMIGTIYSVMGSFK